MAKFRSPWQIQRAVVFALMMRELKTRFEGQLVGGLVWLLVLPMAELMVYLWMNTVIRGRVERGGYEFVVWLLVALAPYKLFRQLWSLLTHAPAANRGLFGFKQVRPMDTFIARTLLEMAIQTVTFVAMALLLARLGYQPLLPVDLLSFLGVVFVFCCTGIALGIIWAVAVDAMPKFANVTHVISMPLMVMSGVIFPLHQLPQEMISWLLLNPLLHLVELARHAYLPGYVVVQGVNARFPIEVALVLSTLAMALYSVRREHLIAR